MDRRYFQKVALGGAASLWLPGSVAAQDDKITITGNGTLRVKGLFEEWVVDVNDVKIAGLTIPKFTWGWLGLNLSSAVISGVGGILFSALTKLLGIGGPSMEDLFKKQLEDIAKIVKQLLEENTRENELRKCSALLQTVKSTMIEYNNAPTPARLDQATQDSLSLISELQSLGYFGYHMFMSAASLRLAILQVRAGFDNREVENFNQARDSYIRYHEEMNNRILVEATLDAAAARNVPPEIEKAIEAMTKAPVPKIIVDTQRSAGLMLAMYREYNERFYDVLPVDFPRIPVANVLSNTGTTENEKRWYREFELVHPLAIGESPTFANAKRQAKAKEYVESKARLMINANPPKPAYVDWKALAQSIRERSTIVGQLIADNWKKAKATN